ncbi:MAG: heparinase II/III family protein [Bacteroidales bacterium]|nr:heparinase II/III family protein [Bacteroidales bacterium]
MKILKYFISALALALVSFAAGAQTVFDRLDLDSPALEKVASAHKRGDDSLAARELLDYFRSRGVEYPGFDSNAPKASQEELRWADEALEHRFFVHKGYQPSYFYGDDIDWTYWPVKDNELRWQLHRHKWFAPMGKAYRLSGDEKYVREWMFQYRDWIAKNPLVLIDNEEFEIKYQGRVGEVKENVRFAWRPLEVSHRVEDQIRQFALMLPAQCFDADFLMDFLDNYYRHVDYLQAHYSEKGNHLLFEAQRVLAASLFFKEFKDAPKWREDAIAILNKEIQAQVYEDGTHFELDPHYHFEAAILFYKALSLCEGFGQLSVFPQSYVQTVHKMIQLSYNQLYPDYSLPIFSDCRMIEKSHFLETFRSWTKVFPEDEYLEYLASEGSGGSLPSWKSKAFPVGGFYILRNGWGSDATVVNVKGGPEAFWHCQPDNGTFEYWSEGRNFFPDSGSFVYGGDASILEQREWFRQTRVHNTVTLDDRNFEKTDSRLLRWKKSGAVTLSNESYPGFVHTRSLRLSKNGTLTIKDVISGEATGEVGVHFNLAPGEISIDALTVRTLFDDGNNIEITSRSKAPLSIRKEEGWTSPVYKTKIERPAYAVTAQKTSSKPLTIVTVIKKTGK